MRILWHSSSPECRTGYGIVTKEAVKRLQDAGHYVRVATKHPYLKWATQSDGLEICEGTDLYLLNQMLNEEKFDFIFTLWDIWMLDGKRQFPKEKWVAYVPVNTMELPRNYRDVLGNTSMQIAQTRFGQDLMKANGFDALYAPHGIDTKTYYPSDTDRAQFRSDIGWTDENFVIGTVGINYCDDTKGIIPLLLAFKRFHKSHPEARLFLCTLANERGQVSSSINYYDVVKVLGLEGVVGWPHQIDYFLNRMGDSDMRRIYNGMDVFCLASRGESFGLPIVEAQGCGIPVIVPNATTGPELCKSGWLIDVDMWDDAIWAPAGVWRYYPKPSKVLAQLENAYDAWRDPDWSEFKDKARVNILEYDWSNVWPKYWEPIVARMDEMLKSRLSTTGKS
jgi:glycosyltransferase involved in cell wall biosynthesis